MSFAIEKNIPLTRIRTGRPGTDFPFADMEVGDSFLMACAVEGDDSAKAIDSWRRKLRLALKKANHGIAEADHYEFNTAVVDGGVRAWRTK